MKYVIVIGDGMADTHLPQLANKTPMEALALNSFDRCAGCYCGRVLTVPRGLPAGSDTAILSIFGYPPKTHYTGRSALEAAGLNVELPQGSVGFCASLCSVLPDENGELVLHSYNGGGICGDEAITLMNDLIADARFAALMQEAGLSITVTDTFRHLGVMKTEAIDLAAVKLIEPHHALLKAVAPHLPQLERDTGDAAARKMGEDVKKLMLLSCDILRDHPVNQKRVAEGRLPANMLWLWGAATAVELPSFREKYGHSGTVVSASPLVWGIARLAGLKAAHVEGANGDIDTNYEGKVQCALDALAAGDDFAVVHVQAPDEMAHDNDLGRKLEAIQNVEYRVVMPLINQLMGRGEDFRLLLLSDHATFLNTRMHSGHPVPWAIFDSRVVRKAIQDGKKPPVRKFCEDNMLFEPVLMEGADLIKVLFEQK